MSSPGAGKRSASKSAAKKAAPKKPRARRGPGPAAKARAPVVLERLRREYPERYCFLDGSEDPFRLLIAVILSAQCTDEQVNRVTPGLFEKYPTAKALAAAPLPRIEKLIYSTGFYKAKAKNVRACAEAIVNAFGGRVPETMEELTSLPGVGRKTANVIQSYCFERTEGVCVDTHVGRLAHRLGLTPADAKDAQKVEADLMRLFPPEDWPDLTYYLISHGRAVCDARRPLCGECVLRDVCPSARKLQT